MAVPAYYPNTDPHTGKKLSPLTDEQLKIIRDTKTDLSTLTDQELQDRSSKLTDVANILTQVYSPEAGQSRHDEFKSAMLSAIDSDKTGNIARFLGKNPNLDSILNQVSDSVTAAGEDLSGSLSKFIPSKVAESFSKKLKDFLPNDISYYQVPRFSIQDISEHNKQITDLLEGRGKTEKAEKLASDFLSSLPGELASHTRDYLTSQYQSAGEQFRTQIAPEIIQNLAVRGLLTTGDLPSELAAGASQSVANVEQQAANLLAQDTSFFLEAGYKDALRKVISSGQDVSGLIATQRETAAREQETRFRGNEAALNRQQQLDLFRRQQDRALAAQEARLRRQSEISSQARTDALIGLAGTAAGSVGGSFVGPSIGKVVSDTISK